MICIKEKTKYIGFRPVIKEVPLTWQVSFDFCSRTHDHFIVKPHPNLNTVIIFHETLDGKRGLSETITLLPGERHYLETIHSDVFTTTRELVVR